MSRQEPDCYFAEHGTFNVPAELIEIDAEGRTRVLRRRFGGQSRVARSEPLANSVAPALSAHGPVTDIISVVDGEGRVRCPGDARIRSLAERITVEHIS